MKIKNIKNHEGTAQERVSTYYPPQHDIIKEIQDGKTIYRNEIGNPIKTYRLTLFDIFDGILGGLRGLVDLLDSDDYNRFGKLADIIIRDADRQVSEVFRLLEHDAGINNLECLIMRRGEYPYTPGRIVGIEIKREACKDDLN